MAEWSNQGGDSPTIRAALPGAWTHVRPPAEIVTWSDRPYVTIASSLGRDPAARQARRATGGRHDRPVGKSRQRADDGPWPRIRSYRGAVSGDLPRDHSPTNEQA